MKQMDTYTTLKASINQKCTKTDLRSIDTLPWVEFACKQITTGNF